MAVIPVVPVTLRYRPGADVLWGEVCIGGDPAVDTQVEAPHADTSLHWQRLADGEHAGQEVLTGFQLVLAHQRGLAELPAEVAAVAQPLVEAGRRALAESTSMTERVRCRVEAVGEVAVVGLVRHPVAR